jgi:hypothetical protein
VIYLSGCVHPDLPSEVGIMLTPMIGNKLPDGRIWAADTGCFGAPDKFSRDRYLRFLSNNDATRCLFATMPDVVGDAVATLNRMEDWPGTIRSAGYKPALVGQDGLESLPVPWDDFDCLFIGGTTEWKLSNHATRLIREANQRGKWTHVGRVNSLKRLRLVQWQGAKSADGTFIAFGPDINIPKLHWWIQSIKRQPPLWGEEFA